jgi:hypothetical protein
VIVDELILKLQADLGDIKKSLAQVEAQGKETGKKTGQGFADAFNAIVGGALAAKVTGFLRSSVTEFNKLEKTLLGLQATAKLTGNSFEALKKSVQTLSSDGVLSIDQASTSMKTLIAQGIQADKAFQLLDAAKKVSSFNNIVGDAGQGVADFVKFLQTGSAELAENMDPSIVKVVKSLGGYAKVSSDATAKQKLINAVIEKGGKLAGDYEKFLNSGAQAQVRFDGASLALSQTLGQKLQPAYTGILNTLTGLITRFTELLDGLSSTSVVFGALAITIPIATFALGKFAAVLGFSVAAALGPISLVVAGIAAIGAVVARNAKTIEERQADANAAYKKSASELEKLTSRANELSKLNSRTASQELELVNTKEQLRKKAQELGVDYDKLAGKVKNYSDQLAFLDRSAKKAAADEANKGVNAELEVRERIFEDYNRRLASARLGADRARAAGNLDEAANLESRIKFLSPRADQTLAEIRRLRSQRVSVSDTEEAPGLADAGSGGGPGSPEYRFIRARDELRKLDLEYDTYIKKFGAKSAEGQEALTRLGIDRGAVTNELKQATAEYIEDRTTAALFAEQAAYQKARANILELANVEKKTKEELQKELQDAEEAHIRKNAQIQAQSFATTLQAANASTTGFANLFRARDAGSGLAGLGGLSSGIAGFSDKFKSFGLVGQGLSAAGGIIAGLTSLFGKSDEERAREAEEQKRRDEEAKAILELQANYQKNMLALQESQAKLPFENLQRQLRLIDINAQTARLGGAPEQQVEAQRLAQRQSAINATLSAESGSIAGGALFGGVQGNAGSLTQFLGERAAQSAAIAQFMALMNAAGAGNLSSGQVLELARQARSYAGLIPNEIYAPAIASLSKFEQADAARSLAQRIAAYEGLRATAGNLNALASEVGIDTSRAESLLSVIEQSNQTQLEIATNTKKTAENTSQLLRPDRQRSFIDVGQGFISSLGQRISPSGVGIARSLSQQGLSLPSEIGLASTTSTLAKTLQERMAEAMEMQVRNGARANDLLSGILRATIELYRVMDGNPATVSGFDNAAADAWLADRERRRF